MKEWFAEGEVHTKKPTQLMAAVSTSYKDGMYGCGLIINNGHWGIEFASFKAFNIKANPHFAELWGLYKLFYRLWHKRLRRNIIVYTNNDWAYTLAKASFARNVTPPKLNTNTRGLEYTQQMLEFISQFKDRVDLQLKKPTLHRSAHKLAVVARDHACGSYDRETARSKARTITAVALK